MADPEAPPGLRQSPGARNRKSRSERSIKRARFECEIPHRVGIIRSAQDDDFAMAETRFTNEQTSSFRARRRRIWPRSGLPRVSRPVVEFRFAPGVFAPLESTIARWKAPYLQAVPSAPISSRPVATDRFPRFPPPGFNDPITVTSTFPVA